MECHIGICQRAFQYHFPFSVTQPGLYTFFKKPTLELQSTAVWVIPVSTVTTLIPTTASCQIGAALKVVESIRVVSHKLQINVGIVGQSLAHE